MFLAHSLAPNPDSAANHSSRANSSSVSFVPTDRVRAAAPFLLEVAATPRKLLTETLHPYYGAAKRFDWKDALTPSKVRFAATPRVEGPSFFEPPKAASGNFRLYDVTGR
jgi:hypothetical protein